MTTEGIKCQICGCGDLEPVLDLGNQPLCNDFLPASQATGPQTYYPLCLYHCPRCFLVQLGYVLPTEKTFGEQYTYLTGSSRSLVDYYTLLASDLVEKHGLNPGDVIIEIGSNDGTFLNAFGALGMRVLGVEGATKAASIAKAQEIPTIPRFFGKGIVPLIKSRLPADSKVRLILAMNVLAHTDNINEFLPEVVALMDADTTFISSSHWLLDLIRNAEFDTIYHEHLRYFTLESLSSLLEGCGLTVFDAERTDFYGGSILVSAKTGASEQSGSLLSVRSQEEGLDVSNSLKRMNLKLLINKTDLLSLLVNLKKAGKRTIGVGAPMKASTLLNFCGITSELVECIAEVNQFKIGTVVPGVGIPVVDEKTIMEDPPDYAILLSWNMADVIIPKYRSMGYKGKFIIPVPEPKVIE